MAKNLTTHVIDRTTDDNDRPLILWRRKGEHHRRLTGWDDGHVWTVQVPSRLGTAEDALDWLVPDGMYDDDTRQGEWFFKPVDARTAWLCQHAWEGGSYLDVGSETEHGTWHQTSYRRGAWTQTRHRAECVVVAQKSGEVAFFGRKGRIRVHKYTAKPRLFVKGKITAPDHKDLLLNGWYEVIGNRAVGAPAAIATGLD
jgi:hypothetical protein